MEHSLNHTADNSELTFLCTSVRMRYSADRSRLAFRLGRIVELNGSGENLQENNTPPLASLITKTIEQK